MINIAVIFGNKGEIEEDLEMYKEVLVINEKTYDIDHKYTEIFHSNIAKVNRAIINMKQT